MQNSDRKDQIAKIKESLSSVNDKRIEQYYKSQFHPNNYKSSSSAEELEKYDSSKGEYEAADKQYEQLFQQMRSLQVQYWVQYESAVIVNGQMKMLPFQETLFLSTLVNIDTTKTGINNLNVHDPDIAALLHEIFDFLYTCRGFSKSNILNIILL